MQPAGIMMAEGAGRERLRNLLASLGFDATVYAGLAPLLRSWRREDVRLLIVDVDMPERDWPGVFAQLHQASSRRAVVVGVGASAGSASVALDAGADDFVALSCPPAELAARVNAALRRSAPVSAPAPDRALSCGPCALDVAARKLVTSHQSIELTSRETELARCLFETPGGLVSRRRLARVWEMEEDLVGRSIEQHVYQLRRKLKRCVGDAVVLRSVYARGYQLDCMGTREAVPAG